LLAVPFQIFRSLWPELITPLASRLTFEMAQSRFIQLVDELFGILEPEAAGRFGAARPISRSYSFGGSFAPPERHKIIQAGKALRMIEAEYDGIRRLIEPYKLEFKIRKKDNRGFEYFYGYDRTGGRSTPPGIKTFFSDKVRAVAITDLPFQPRYPVEF
jgi:hypothetical protein